MNPPRFFARLALVVLVACTTSCSAAVRVEISNNSGMEISSIEMVAGSSGALLEILPGGMSATQVLVPRVDSALDLEFETATGGRHKCVIDVYLTRGLRGRIGVEINSNLSCALRFDETSIWPQ
ncbi:MAG: hypothetical protein KF823_00530 [Xanthomonadales bacterium]|nr:hypothetical protein [Xanthomonadales bacterium]